MDVVVAMGMPTSNILKCTALGGSKEGEQSCTGVLCFIMDGRVEGGE